MSRQVPVLTLVETNPVVLSAEQTAILNMGTTVEDAARQIETTCKRECALGSRACNLSVDLSGGDDGEQVEVKASCSDCPNPAVAQMAVGSLVNYADRRIDAISGVEPKISDTADPQKPEHDDPFFGFVHKISDPKLGEFHGISLEALTSLPGRGEGSNLPTRVMNVLARAGLAEDQQYPRLLVNVRSLETKVDTEYPYLVVAESMDILLDDSDIRSYPNMGKSSMELLQQARQKVIERRIPQRSRLEDTSIGELEIGVQAYNVLRQDGIHSLLELTVSTADQIGNIDGMTVSMVEEIREKLGLFGLDFQSSPEED